MGFWDKALSTPGRPATPPPPSQNLGNGGWWNTQFVPNPAPSQQQVIPGQQQGNYPAPNAYVPKAMPPSASQATRCPRCGSNDFMSSDGVHQARCFDCGHSARIDQTTLSGISGMGGNSPGPTQVAKQSSSTMTGFHGNISSAAEASGRVVV